MEIKVQILNMTIEHDSYCDKIDQPDSANKHMYAHIKIILFSFGINV